MIVKIFKGVWFFSLLAAVGTLMFVYASLPEQVIISGAEPHIEVSRNAVFYTMLAIYAIVNVLVFVVGSVLSQEDQFLRGWSLGLVSLLNLFLIVTVQFISVLNSSEKFDYGRIGYIIYGAVGLIIIWSLACPVYYARKQFAGKQTVG